MKAHQPIRRASIFLVLQLIVGTAHALDAPTELVPAGLNPGDKFYVVFTSSMDQTAVSTNISTYNAIVQGLAASSSIAGVRSISGYFNVIGATSTNNQCQPADLTKPVYTVTKRLISSSVSSMFTPPAVNLSSPLNVNESGVAATNGISYTGCNTDGSPLINNELGQSNVAVGLTSVTNNQWLYYGAPYPSGPTYLKALYAISALLTVPTPTAQAVPTLSEWAQLMLGLMVISILGWQWRKQKM
jgi:hypothetical protein